MKTTKQNEKCRSGYSLMIRNFLFLVVFALTAFNYNTSVSQDLISVHEVYTNPDILIGDTIRVAGYYTNPNQNLLLEFYGDLLKDEPLPPQTSLKLYGPDPPENTWNGGYLIVRGILEFESITEYFYPEDSIIAIIYVLEITVVLENLLLDMRYQWDGFGKDHIPEIEEEDFSRQACDSCNFAILISGAGSPEKYWKNLSALYNHKVNTEKYCPHNVFVHFHNGVRADATIPQNRVSSATRANIQNSHTEISRRVAECNRKGKKATFQKLVTGHGASNGDIAIFGSVRLPVSDLRSWQQRIIDSCARTIKDEFIQCYAGHAVDETMLMDHKNKATIYANANCDKFSGLSWPTEVNSYLQGKINALALGRPYDSAIIAAKLAYDSWLQNFLIPYLNQRLAYWNAQVPNTPPHNYTATHINQRRTELQDLKNLAQSSICKSPNKSIKPMSTYCEWVRYVVPPGGQLVLDFNSDNTTCANVTVYRIDPVTGDTIKIRVWNWNNPHSHRFQPGNQRRVINGTGSTPTTFLVHNDARQRFVITGDAPGNQTLPQSPSNAPLYAGYSFGGRDGSAREFHYHIQPAYYVEQIDRIPISLSEIPARMGGGFVQTFAFDFTISHTDEYWTDMLLTIDVAEVFAPGVLEIITENTPFGFALIEITEPGRYEILLGDMTFGGPLGFMTMMIPDFSGLQFSFDSWGLTTVYEPPVYPVLFFIVNQEGDPVSGALIHIPGYGELFSDEYGVALIELPNEQYVATISKYGHDETSIDFMVQSVGQEIFVILNRYILALDDLIVFADDMQCFESMVGIELNNSVFESGSISGVVAGSWINIINTHVQYGAEFHAYIDENGVFCSDFYPPLEKISGELSDDLITTEALEKDKILRIFPNPTPGIFTLELNTNSESSVATVEILSILGEKIMRSEVKGKRQHQFDLSDRQSGIYLIRVTIGDNVVVEKIVKQ